MKDIKEIKYGVQGSEVDERLMELSSLFDILRTLSSSLNLQSVLNNILLTPMGRMMISKGAVLLEKGPNEYVIEALKGLPRELLGKSIHIDILPEYPVLTEEAVSKEYSWAEFLTEFDLQISLPINSSNKTLGLLIYGKKLSDAQFTEKEIEFLSSISNISATTIENSLMFTELQEVNRKLDHSNQELNTLFDIGGELNSTLDSKKIIKVLGFALMGQLLVNKYAVYLKDDNCFNLEGCKGFRDLLDSTDESITTFLSGINEPYQVDKGGDEKITDWLNAHNIKLLIPMKLQDNTNGIICLGEKINKLGYSKENMEFLLTLANQSMISLENARLFEETLEKQRMEEELAVARDIQSRLLPKELPSIEELDIHAVNVSSKAVGGDYYDIVELDDVIVGVVIADVSGKGVPASLLMANIQASFRALSTVMKNPAKMTGTINNIIYANTSSDKFITYFYCMINKKTLEVEYCNAGHNPPLVISADKKIRKLDKGGLILGMLPDVEYLRGTDTLEKGDALVLFTDGITEALDADSEEFEEHRLEEVCRNYQSENAKNLFDEILGAVKAFSGDEPQSDDITLITLKVH